MSHFPFYINIQQKKGILIADEDAMRKEILFKVDKLLPFGPILWLVSEYIPFDFERSTEVICKRRKFQESDLIGASFVVVATNDEAYNRSICEQCRNRGVFINVVDEVDKCDFIFPSILHKGKLTVGVTTEGASPQIGIEIRKHLEDYLPTDIEQILDYLMEIREEAKQRIQKDEDRRNFLKELSSYCFKTGTIPNETIKEEWFDGYEKK